MGSMVLVLGGARSGKSSFAQRYTLRLEEEEGREVVFVATARAGDDEMAARIEAHRRDRPARWRTVEEELRVSQAIERNCRGKTAVIVDCLTMLVTNIMLGPPALEPRALTAAVDAEIDAIARVVGGLDCRVMVVSNETGMGVVPDTELGRIFRDAAGRANQRVAALADEVYFLVAGLPQRLK